MLLEQGIEALEVFSVEERLELTVRRDGLRILPKAGDRGGKNQGSCEDKDILDSSLYVVSPYFFEDCPYLSGASSRLR